MSIRGNSSLSIKFTQIDSKFSLSVIYLYLGVDDDPEICLFICFVLLERPSLPVATAGAALPANWTTGSKKQGKEEVREEYSESFFGAVNW